MAIYDEDEKDSALGTITADREQGDGGALGTISESPESLAPEPPAASPEPSAPVMQSVPTEQNATHADAPLATASDVPNNPVPPTGKEQFHRAMHDFDTAENEAIHKSQQTSAMMTTLDPSANDYLPKLGILQAEQANSERQRGQITADRLAFQNLHPWGSPESAHPGIGGEIGHVLGRIGNIAGDVLAPEEMTLIPGTDLNNQIQHKSAMGEINQGADIGLKGAQTQALENPEEKPIGEPVADGKGGYVQTMMSKSGPHLVPVQTAQPQASPIQPQAMGTIPQTAQSQPSDQAGMAAGGGAPPPAGTKMGAVPEKKTEEEKFQDQYLLDKKLPDTAANRLAAHEAFGGKAPLGDAAKEWGPKIANALAGSGLNPADYPVTGTMSEPEAREQLGEAAKAAAGDRANKSAERVAGAPAAAEQRKMEHNYGYGADKDGNTIYTTEAKAADAGTVFEPVSAADVNKDRQAITLMGNVQLNASNYKKTVDSLTHDISTDDASRMAAFLSNKDLGAKLELFGAGIKMDAINDAWTKQYKQSMLTSLPADEQKALFDYLRAKGAVIAYQRALTNQGRTNPEALAVEFDTIPLPFVGSTTSDISFGRFQENIDQVSSRLPNNLPGVTSPKSVRDKIENGAGGAWKPPTGAPSAKGVPDGKVLKSGGAVVGVAKNGEWTKP